MNALAPDVVIHGLVPAGGVGQRAQTTGQTEPKQYRLLQGRPMLVWAVQALLADSRVKDVVVGVQADDAFAQMALAGLSRVRISHSAGPSRAQTVLQTLRDSDFDRNDWVLVHDAARPGLPAANLQALIDACLAHQQGGVLALPATDTIKIASQTAPLQVQRTVDRQTVWLAQTPQMFEVGALMDALTRALAAGVPITDEASAMEWAGHGVLLIEGSAQNRKVTWPQDFQAIERFL